VVDLAANLEPDDEEKDGHQTVVDDPFERPLGAPRADAQPDGRVPKAQIGLAIARVGAHEGEERREEQEDAAARLDAQEALERARGEALAPAPKPDEHAKIVADQIVIDEKIQFAYDSAVILPVSHGILDAVVKVMVDNPQITRVRVEGHASDEGHGAAANAYNKALSDRRARSVMQYLVGKGIDKGRLESAGFGVEQPIAGNDSEEGRERNRRVEFRIVTVAGAGDREAD
jgi:OOP family OmpA-OmpF porin